MKLLIDMNLSPRWIAFLANAGWEAVHWSTVGRFDAKDSEIMTYAGENGYVGVNTEFGKNRTLRNFCFK
jgi:predicted nuclease of predicted toxin-antitoxin system